MTTASRRTTHRRRYRSNALTTTAVTVVPSARAFSTAACHTSSGMRSERGIVGMSVHPRGAAGGAVVGLVGRVGVAGVLDGDDRLDRGAGVGLDEGLDRE